MKITDKIGGETWCYFLARLSFYFLLHKISVKGKCDADLESTTHLYVT